MGKHQLSKRLRRRLRRGHRPSKTKRERVFERSYGQCHYCGCHLTMETMTLDHVIPRSKGGTSDILNLVAACKPCNQAKADALPRWMQGPI